MDNKFKNINNSFLQQNFKCNPEQNTIEIMKIVDNTIKLIKDENKLIELCTSNATEDKISILTSALLFLGEIKNIISEDINYEELVHKYMINCKEYIEKNLAYIPMSLYGGLADIGLSIYSVNKATGNYDKILNTINNLLLESTLYRLTQIELNPKNIKMGDFDVMAGLSGVANYLFLFYEEENIRNVIIKIIKYFIGLTKRIDFLGYNLPNYYISNENQFTDFDKQLYKKGCINFSLSHGMAGPMLIMSKALKLGINIEGQEEAIRIMLDDIIEYSYVNKLGYMQFTGRISFEKYINKDIDKINSRAAWCYGAPGIVKAVYVANDIIKDEKAFKIAENSLEYLVKYPDKWELDSPTICHGLAGLLAYFESIVTDANNNEVSNQINNITQILIGMYDNSSCFGYADSSNVEPQFYSKWFCTTQGYIECIVTIITTLVTELSCQDYSCGCPGAGATDVEFGCPPKDTGTLDVCVNNINNTY